jgi:hypothetical protein
LPFIPGQSPRSLTLSSGLVESGAFVLKSGLSRGPFPCLQGRLFSPIIYLRNSGMRTHAGMWIQQFALCKKALSYMILINTVKRVWNAKRWQLELKVSSCWWSSAVSVRSARSSTVLCESCLKHNGWNADSWREERCSGR